jgi:hypothetical protein
MSKLAVNAALEPESAPLVVPTAVAAVPIPARVAMIQAVAATARRRTAVAVQKHILEIVEPLCRAVMDVAAVEQSLANLPLELCRMSKLVVTAVVAPARALVAAAAVIRTSRSS